MTTLNLEPIEGFDRSTKAAYKLIHLAGIPEGFIGFFPNFFKVLARDKTCKKSYANLMQLLKFEDEEIQMHKQAVIDWMKNHLEKLQSLKCIEYLEVRNAINDALSILSGERYEITSWGYLKYIKDNFERACRAVACHDSSFDPILYPKEMNIWEENSDINRYKVSLDQNATQNLRFLLHLCEFEKMQSVLVSSFTQPQSLFEAEAHANFHHMQRSLRRYKTNYWDKAPKSKEEIISILNRLLAFLHVESNVAAIKPRGTRIGKDEACHWVQEILKNAWSEIERENKPRNYQPLRLAVFKAQKNASQNILRALSPTLINKEITKFAKEKKFRAVRSKDKVERHRA